MSQGEGGGRPPKFKTVKELDGLINAYFNSCFEDEWVSDVVRDDDGTPKIDKKTGKPKIIWEKRRVQKQPFTVTGLALALDTTRETLLDYESGKYDRGAELDENGEIVKEEVKFSDAIKRAKTKIEEQLENKLFETQGRHTGLIFNLKNNFRWRDRSEIDHSTLDKPLNHDSDEVKKEIKALRVQLAKEYEKKRKALL